MRIDLFTSKSQSPTPPHPTVEIPLEPTIEELLRREMTIQRNPEMEQQAAVIFSIFSSIFCLGAYLFYNQEDPC